MSSPVDHGIASKSGTSAPVLLSSDPPPALDDSVGAAVLSPSSSTALLVPSSSTGVVVGAPPLVELDMLAVSPLLAGSSPPQAATRRATIVRRDIVVHAITQALRMSA